MARKSVALLPSKQKYIDAALEDWKIISEVKADLAQAAYNAQPLVMQDAIDQMQRTLRIHAHNYVNVQLDPPHGGIVPVKVEQKYVDWNLLYIVTDMLSNLALHNVRVGEYIFPPSLCVKCQAEIEVRQMRVRRNRG